MRLFRLIALLQAFTVGCCDKTGRQPLTYALIPEGVYVPPKNSTIVTLLDFVHSRSDLTTLATIIGECGG